MSDVMFCPEEELELANRRTVDSWALLYRIVDGSHGAIVVQAHQQLSPFFCTSRMHDVFIKTKHWADFTFGVPPPSDMDANLTIYNSLWENE